MLGVYKLRLKDKVALITGAGSGIGKEIALLFAKSGAKIIIFDLDSIRGKETVKEINSEKGIAIFIKGDITKKIDVQKAIKISNEKFSRIDILCNNAGISGPADMIEDIDEQMWNNVIDINLKGVYLCSKYVIQEMVRNGGGVIINIASIAGLHALSKQAVYNASKAGVILLTKSMAIDYANKNIRVNSICPGIISTPLTMNFLSKLPDSKKSLQTLLDKIPTGRLGKPEEIAYTALFLASDESSYINGSTLVVDGGMTSGWTR